MNNCFNRASRSVATTFLDISKNTALETFECNQNGFTTLDVSNNTKLKVLSCDENSLTEIHVDRNIDLQSFSCHTNLITQLDVSKNTQLSYLNCGGNLLTEIDVTYNTALSNFSCWRNKLVAINVNNNTALNYLSCHTNQLTQLDISKNDMLQILCCEYNQLTELTLQNASNLEHLVCYSNKIQTLDISPCLSLENVQCGNQKDIVLSLIIDSSQKSAWENTWKAMDTNTNVILSGEETPADPDKTITNLALISRIETQHKVTFTRNADGYVDVEENKAILESITDLTISYGSEIDSLQGIEHLINLETVWCSFINATTLDVSRNTKLKKLWITLVNNLKEAKLGNLPELADLELTGLSNKILTEELDISGCPNLQRLCFNNTNLTTLDVSHCSQLRALSCYNNQLTTLDIRNNPNLTSLSCYGNNMATLDITQNPLLEKLTCGNQNNVSNLVLTLSDDQKTTWESTWKALENNTNVILSGEETPTDPDGNKGQLPGLDNGGVF